MSPANAERGSFLEFSQKTRSAIQPKSQSIATNVTKGIATNGAFRRYNSGLLALLLRTRTLLVTKGITSSRSCSVSILECIVFSDRLVACVHPCGSLLDVHTTENENVTYVSGCKSVTGPDTKKREVKRFFDPLLKMPLVWLSGQPARFMTHSV